MQPAQHAPVSDGTVSLDTAFLDNGGDLGELIRGFDWSATSLGPVTAWPQSIRTVITFVLRSNVPVVTLWNQDGVMIYNDAYAAFSGGRHPSLLGLKVREAWPEVAWFNDNVMKHVLAGGTLAYRDQELTLSRHGKPEQVWLDLDYSPLCDERGRPVGVMAIVNETTAKVRAEQSLKSEHQRLRDMFEQAPGFMTLLRGPTHITELANPALLALIGRDQDILDRPIRDCLPELDHQGFFQILDRVFASGDVYNGNQTPVSLRRGRNGELEQRFIDFVFQPIKDVAGATTGIFVQGTDITAKVHAEAAAREIDEQFHIVAQTMPNHVWTARPDGHLDWFNDRVYEYTGAGEGELTGAGWAGVVHPDDLPAALDRWSAALASGQRYDAEFRIRQHDGVYRWYIARAMPFRDDQTRVQRWIGTNTDIHERKSAEAVGTAERDRIWNSTNDLMATGGADGCLQSVNPAWARLLGYSEAELLGRPIQHILYGENHQRITAIIAALARGEAVADFEDRLRHHDGAVSTIAWTAAPAGAVFHLVGRNVTEQRAAEEALRQSQKMEAVGQLTGGIAHDFNNLLQGITGSLDLLQKRIAQGRVGELDRFVAGAMGAANRAAALTHRLLAFSRRQPLDPKPVKANPLIGAMEDLLRRTLGERVLLELVLAGGLWPTLCDPNQLENAVLNLAINARDAMPDGGHLTIETGNAHLDSAYAAQRRDVRPGQYVCIGVTDTGAGMSADTISKAFEPFFTTKPIGQGTGLGLSMIYGFARQSEGYVKIYSELGRGTTVKLYLPRLRGPEEAAEALPELSQSRAAAPGEAVLVVEDEPVVRGLIVEVLNDLGYHALEAADGIAGLGILQSARRIDLLVTDIGLPGLNGRQMAEAARLTRPGLRVLFMTGYAENAALAAGFLEPGMAMMTKPFAMEVLATRIREMIEEK